MAFAKGNNHGTGRPPGSRNKGSALTDEARKQLAARADGIAPLEFAASVLRDPDAPLKEKKWACELLMPYMHQKLPTAVNLRSTQVVTQLDPEALKSMPAEKLIELMTMALQLTKDVETEE